MIPAHARIARKTLPTTLLATLMAAGFVALSPPMAKAQESSPPAKAGRAEARGAPSGLWLTTPYPAFDAQPGNDIAVDLALANAGMPPQRVELGVEGLPDGWTWHIEGGGRDVEAAIAPADKTVDLSLRLTPPDDAKTGTYDFKVTGKTGAKTLDLPLELTLAETEPGKLTMEPDLPALKGTVRSSFDFQVSISNEGQKDAVVNLLSKAPSGFEVSFKERYGKQELTSLPIDAGKSKDVTVSVEPPDGAEAGQYPVRIAASGGDLSAESKLVLDITGRPNLALSGPGGRLSGSATAGEERTFNFHLENTGTAPARKVALSANPPQGWKVAFSPETIDEIPPGETSDVAVAMTPSSKAIAGDYMVSVRANGDGASDSANLRVTVETSTLWGAAGLGVIAAAVLVLGFAVSRYGRR